MCSPADNAAELQSGCSWKPELQTGGEMAPYWLSCWAVMSERGGGHFIKELVTDVGDIRTPPGLVVAALPPQSSH